MRDVASEQLRLIGESATISRIKTDIETAGRSDAKVLILGETGVGKDIVARLIHQHSMRAHAPLVTINCAGLPDSLLESELFGHIRGSFTGAYRDKAGLLETASGGTVFLDEVGEMSPRMQTVLLRFLETGEIQRIGSTRSQSRVDVRLITATNRDFQKHIASGGFREDLYYRLNVISLTIPPLRDRRDDILLLIDHFLDVYSLQHRTRRPWVTPDALAALVAYRWPGNVRELKNVIERAVILSSGDEILPEDLPLELRTHIASKAPLAGGQDYQPANLDELKKKQIISVLEQTGWHQGKASEILGISPSTLYRQLKSYGLTRARRVSENGTTLDVV
jgi:DNA-binding NtrC family response regulator